MSFHAVLDVNKLPLDLVVGRDLSEYNSLEEIAEDINLWLQCCEFTRLRVEWSSTSLYLVCYGNNKEEFQQLLDFFGGEKKHFSSSNQRLCYYCESEDCHGSECGNYNEM
jgi:hypothetical protein